MDTAMSHTASAQSAAPADSTLAPRPLRRMDTLAPYKQGKMAIPGRESVIKLSKRKRFGPSPRALEARSGRAASIQVPGRNAGRLRGHCAGAWHDPDRIVRQWLRGIDRYSPRLPGENEELLLTRIIYDARSTAKHSCKHRSLENDYVVDIDALLERITPQTRHLVANPNNPTEPMCRSGLRAWSKRCQNVS
jgi:histidinol-phosphate/aromatic aminotransferase/cobyric acid decarboxylase-like protein